MEINPTKKNQPFIRISGIAWLLITLAVGILLGAFLYAGLGSKIFPLPSLEETASELPEAAESESPSDTVQISPESQRDVGITVEPADRRSLQMTLTATGIVSEDPGRVAHIRPLARGLVEKTYARLGDRVSTGDPLIEYDNIDLGLAIGEFLSAQAELQTMPHRPRSQRKNTGAEPGNVAGRRRRPDGTRSSRS